MKPEHVFETEAFMEISTPDIDTETTTCLLVPLLLTSHLFPVLFITDFKEVNICWVWNTIQIQTCPN